MSQSKKSAGYLELIIGPMFSGKTSRIVEMYNQCKFCNIPVAVINHVLDNRYDAELLSTHDKIKIPCIKASKLGDVCNDPAILKADVILINEGQFFEDLYQIVDEFLKKGKKIYIVGLDGDFERKKFGIMLDLIPLSDKVTKLTSLCSSCKDGTPGIFSMRLTGEKIQKLVGSENYIPVCRKCYNDSF